MTEVAEPRPIVCASGLFVTPLCAREMMKHVVPAYDRATDKSA